MRARGYGLVRDDEELCEYLLKEGRVCLVPGSAFGQGPAMRLSYAADLESLVEAVRRMKDALSRDQIG